MDLTTFVAVSFCAAVFAVVCKNNLVGLIVFCTGLVIFSSQAKADSTKPTYYTFHYNTPDQLKITVPADSKEEAFNKAKSMCYQILTKGVYQGEARSLEIIDICVNPK